MVVLLLLLCCPAQAALNVQYLVPGGGVQIHKQFRTAKDPVKVCALTFDDGPDEQYTMKVMQTLDKLQVQATFFLVGERIEEYPEQVGRLVRSGHEIGNHSYSHPDLSRLSESDQLRQLSRTSAILGDLGVETRWFRPPYGSANRTTIRLAEELGMDVVRWSVDPRDWAQPGASVITKRVTRNTCPGAVILLHSTNAQTLAALPVIIENLRGKGYTFVTLSQWKAIVTGENPQTTSLQPPLPEYTEITPVTDIDDPFYNPYGTEPIPVVYEELEQLSPHDSAHTAWNDPGNQPATPLMTQSSLQPARLTVYSNFQSDSDLTAVYRSGGSSRLYAYKPVVPTPDPVVTVLDAPSGLTATVTNGMPRRTTGSAAPTMPIRQPMPSLEFSFQDENHPLAWVQPGKLTTAALTAATVVGAELQSPDIYLIIKENPPGKQSWDAVADFSRQARISGLVFPTVSFFGSPPAGMDYPWTFAGPQTYQGLPVINLDSEACDNLLALSTAGIQSILLEAPDDVTALRQPALADFILLRQLTAGLPAVTRPADIAHWQLPDSVIMHCFGRDSQVTLVLINSSGKTQVVELPPELMSFSRAELSGPDTISLTPVVNPLFTIDRSPVIFYYDAPAEGK